MTGDITLMRTIGLMLVAATVLLLLTRKLLVPNIVVYIFGGLVMGPVLGLVTPEDKAASDVLPALADIGIALLLFLVGLELSFQKLRDVGKVALVAGLGQIVFTFVVGFMLSLPFGFSLIEAAMIALALTFSSTVVVVKLLRQKKELSLLYGRLAVGIFLVQNVAVILGLTMLAGAGAGPVGVDGAASGPSAGASYIVGLAKAALSIVFLLGLSLLTVRFVMRPVFAWASRSPEVLLVWGMTWCFVFVLLAERLGVSIELGAFIAGVSLAQHPANQELSRRLGPLTNFFIALFFLSLGAGMDIGQATQHWKAAIVLSAVVLLTNPIFFLFSLGRFGYSEKTTFKTSVSLAQLSEFSLIFIAMAVSREIVDESVLSLVTVIALITIVGSAYMILFNEQFYQLCKRVGLLKPFRLRDFDDEDVGGVQSGHVIVIGMNPFGRGLVRRLSEAGREVLAIDTDPRKLRGLSCSTLHGDVENEDLIEQAGLARASCVVSALQIEETNRLLAWRCKALSVPVMIHAFDQSVVKDLKGVGADRLIDSKALGSARLVLRLVDDGVVSP